MNIRRFPNTNVDYVGMQLYSEPATRHNNIILEAVAIDWRPSLRGCKLGGLSSKNPLAPYGLVWLHLLLLAIPSDSESPCVANNHGGC
jgi:hypothetical protein